MGRPPGPDVAQGLCAAPRRAACAGSARCCGSWPPLRAHAAKGCNGRAATCPDCAARARRPQSHCARGVGLWRRRARLDHRRQHSPPQQQLRRWRPPAPSQMAATAPPPRARQAPPMPKRQARARRLRQARRAAGRQAGVEPIAASPTRQKRKRRTRQKQAVGGREARARANRTRRSPDGRAQRAQEEQGRQARAKQARQPRTARSARTGLQRGRHPRWANPQTWKARATQQQERRAHQRQARRQKG